MKRAWGRAHAAVTRSPKEKVLLDKREEGGELRGPAANAPVPRLSGSVRIQVLPGEIFQM